MCYGPDLAALGHGAEHGWFNSFLEDSLNAISRRLTAVSQTTPPLVPSNHLPTSLLPSTLFNLLVSSSTGLTLSPDIHLDSSRLLLLNCRFCILEQVTVINGYMFPSVISCLRGILCILSPRSLLRQDHHLNTPS